MPLRPLSSALLLLLTVFLTPSFGQDSDILSQKGFGSAVAISGSDIFVGEPLNERIPGRVYLFRRASETGAWEQSGVFTAPSSEVGDGFGSGLATARDELVVAATGGPKQAIYVFRQSENGEWTEAGSIRPSEHGLTGRLLGPVTLHDDRLHVLLAAEAGPVQLATFERQLGEWILARKSLVNISLGDGGTAAMAAGGGRLVIGDPQHEDGRVVLFESSEHGWTAVQEIVSPARADTSRPEFGSSVAALGNRLLVGSPGVMADSGRVYVLQGDLASLPTRFDLVDSLGAPTLEDDPRLGSSLAAEGPIVVVGARDEFFGYGGAFIFGHEASSNTWSLIQVLEPELTSGYASIVGSDTRCEDGAAGGFGCLNVDLRSFLNRDALGLESRIQLNDVWGWTDPDSGKDYAIVCAMDRTVFIDASDPNNPLVLGSLPATPGTRSNWWRDAKVYKHYAYIVADRVGNHGLQVFDLTQLREVADPPVVFEPTAQYWGFDSAHNIFINEETGFAYVVGIDGGGNTCGGGSHILDLSNPLDPQFVGCFAHEGTGENQEGASHDTQCVVYHGPDSRYRGREICVGSNETAISVADVTDKANIIPIAVGRYPGSSYTHQGWFSEDHHYFYQNDETDEINDLTDGTRTMIWDLAELDDPVLAAIHVSDNKATDHNYYVVGDRLYQSNYLAGLRILDISDPTGPVEVGYFDTVPWGDDRPGFGGSWSNYPFFESGLIVVTSGEEGVFFLKRSDAAP